MVCLNKRRKRSDGFIAILRSVAFFVFTVLFVSTLGVRAFCADFSDSGRPHGNSAKNLSEYVKEIPQDGLFRSDVTPFEDVYRNRVIELYKKVGFKPVFLTNGRLNAKGKRLIDRINSLKYDGIDVTSYALVPVRKKLANVRALNEILEQLRACLAMPAGFLSKRFSPGYLSYVRCKLNPGTVSFTCEDEKGEFNYAADSCKIFMEVIASANKALMELNQTASDLDAMLIVRAFQLAKDMGVKDEQAVMDTLSENDDLSNFLDLIEPGSPHYAPLRRELMVLMNKCEYPGGPPRFSSKTLRPGDVSGEVAELKKRLMWEGYYHGTIDDHYDESLKQAVKEFQRANALQVDGIAGPETKEALKTPLREKIRYVKLALAQFREEPLRDLERGIVINIPQFSLELYQNGKIIERHRVIVGRAQGKKKKKIGNKLVGINQTPVLQSKITRIVFKPRWYVNKRILKELEAESQGDPEYYQRQGFVFLPPRRPGGLPRVYQKPGEKNALGLVKFEFPNRFQVYLHDTPTKHLFARSRRDFSHGCIRVQNALVLARKLLELDGNKALKSIGKYLKRKNPTYVKLNTPIPIYVRYIPASTDGSGNVVILRDIYGRLKDKVDNKTMICRIGR